MNDCMETKLIGCLDGNTVGWMAACSMPAAVIQQPVLLHADFCCPGFQGKSHLHTKFWQDAKCVPMVPASPGPSAFNLYDIHIVGYVELHTEAVVTAYEGL